MTTLVVGGAGYIGAHVVKLLQCAGRDVVVVDDLSTGLAERVDCPLVRLDVTSATASSVLVRTMREHQVTSVVHFAAKKDVGESVRRPAHYFRQNVGGMATLLEAMEEAGVGALVFSSSAAVYGNARDGRVTEESPTVPVNPYGETKLVCEQLIRHASRAWALSATALRYFNVAGAGEARLRDTAVANLVSIALDHARRGEPVTVHGADYATPDGTCIRDYVHVTDLAEAHVAALDHALHATTPTLEVFNIGTGHGASVLEMLDALERALGRPLLRTIGPRRSGDPERVVADVRKAAETLHWKATRTLDDIAASAV